MSTPSEPDSLVDRIAHLAERRVECVLEQARTLLGGLGLAAPRPTQVRPAPAATPARRSATATPDPVSDGEPAPPSEDLPIPAYDSLSASQVVPRLASLEADELEMLRRYELAGRSRRTILNRIVQLQSA